MWCIQGRGTIRVSRMKRTMPNLKFIFFRTLLDWTSVLPSLSLCSVIDLIDPSNLCNWLYGPLLYTLYIWVTFIFIYIYIYINKNCITYQIYIYIYIYKERKLQKLKFIDSLSFLQCVLISLEHRLLYTTVPEAQTLSSISTKPGFPNI